MTNASGFTAKERDSETGLDFFQARYYGSALERFTSPDPANVGASASDPQSWNAYSYAANRPLSAIDPDGLDCITTSNQTSSGVTVTTERGGSAETCSGTYVNGTVDTSSYQYNGTSLGYSFSNDTASGAGTIAFSKYFNDDSLSPDVASMLNRAGNMAAPGVDLAGHGLLLFASAGFPLTTTIGQCVVGDCDASDVAMAAIPHVRAGEWDASSKILSFAIF